MWLVSILTPHLRNEIMSQRSLTFPCTLPFALCLGCCKVILCKTRDSHKSCHGGLLWMYILFYYVLLLGLVLAHARSMLSPRWKLRSEDFTENYTALGDRPHHPQEPPKEKEKNQNHIHKRGFSHVSCWSISNNLQQIFRKTLITYSYLCRTEEQNSSIISIKLQKLQMQNSKRCWFLCLTLFRTYLSISVFMVKTALHRKSPFLVNVYYISCV